MDAASFVPNSRLDLEKYSPDFVAISFYKMFGYPGGLGALIVKNSTSKILKKNYFGGGTVFASISDKDFHVFRDKFSDKHQDGTIPFSSIVSLKYGFQLFDRLGIDKIEE